MHRVLMRLQPKNTVVLYICLTYRLRQWDADESMFYPLCSIHCERRLFRFTLVFVWLHTSVVVPYLSSHEIFKEYRRLGYVTSGYPLGNSYYHSEIMAGISSILHPRYQS
jgi:hypothetical protein